MKHLKLEDLQDKAEMLEKNIFKLEMKYHLDMPFYVKEDYNKMRKELQKTLKLIDKLANDLLGE